MKEAKSKRNDRPVSSALYHENTLTDYSPAELITQSILCQHSTSPVSETLKRTSTGLLMILMRMQESMIVEDFNVDTNMEVKALGDDDNAI